MAGPSDSDYKCQLDEKSLKKAETELNEDPKNRLGAVETFRQWIEQQPHICCPTDITFLLTFLRVRYFSQLEARKLLENFLQRRSKFSHWFKNLDPADPKIHAVLDTGMYLLLPERDAEGRKIMIIRPGQANLKDKSLNKMDILRTFACLIDVTYFCDENTTVNGTVHIIDFDKYGFMHQSFMSLEERRDFMQTWQANYPARVKQVHIYNIGAMAEVIMGIVKHIMAEKIQQRLKVHGQVLENLYNDIPQRYLPAEYLPDDYEGPNQGTEQQIIDGMKRLFSSPEIRSRVQYLSQEKWGIDESKRPSAAGSVPSASFRKLNID